MQSTIYVPVLKWKKGEKVAIAALEPQNVNFIVPLFEIVDEYDSTTLASEIVDIWSKEFYFDTSYVDAGDKDQLVELMNEMVSLGVPGYPVLNYYDRHIVDADFCSKTGRIAFRIAIPADIEDPDSCTMIEDILKITKQFETPCDLILDLGVVADKKEAPRSYRDVKDIINSCLIPQSFRNNLIISLTSFPESLADMPSTNELRCERFEFKLWKKTVTEYPNTLFAITYSDYGVAKFTESDIDFRKLKYGVLPKARYTTFDEYWIIKGVRDRVTKEMTKGFIQIAKQICESPDYFGKDFSYGDLDIYERANGLNKKKSGNNVNWITIGTNHHIAVVLKQLSNHYDL